MKEITTAWHVAYQHGHPQTSAGTHIHVYDVVQAANEWNGFVAELLEQTRSKGQIGETFQPQGSLSVTKLLQHFVTDRHTHTHTHTHNIHQPEYVLPYQVDSGWPHVALLREAPDCEVVHESI